MFINIGICCAVKGKAEKKKTVQEKTGNTEFKKNEKVGNKAQTTNKPVVQNKNPEEKVERPVKETNDKKKAESHDFSKKTGKKSEEKVESKKRESTEKIEKEIENESPEDFDFKDADLLETIGKMMTSQIKKTWDTDDRRDLPIIIELFGKKFSIKFEDAFKKVPGSTENARVSDREFSTLISALSLVFNELNVEFCHQLGVRTSSLLYDGRTSVALILSDSYNGHGHKKFSGKLRYKICWILDKTDLAKIQKLELVEGQDPRELDKNYLEEVIKAIENKEIKIPRKMLIPCEAILDDKSIVLPKNMFIYPKEKILLEDIFFTSEEKEIELSESEKKIIFLSYSLSEFAKNIEKNVKISSEMPGVSNEDLSKMIMILISYFTSKIERNFQMSAANSLIKENMEKIINL